MHSGCLHWQVSSGVFFASAHVSLQCFFPGAAVSCKPGVRIFLSWSLKLLLLAHAFSRLKALLCGNMLAGRN